MSVRTAQPSASVRGSGQVTFHNGATQLRGTLHRLVDDMTSRSFGVIVSGSWLTIKAQMADRYAPELAERGFTAG
jgi:uncharacterized protein